MMRRLGVPLSVAWQILDRVWLRVLSWFSFLASLLRQPSQIEARWPEAEATLGPRVAIFVHWDRRGAVQEPVRHYLRALRQAGLSIVFVSNSGKLRQDAWDALHELCDIVLVRRNIGYDFGAMREGLEVCALPRPETEMVLIVNDSVYGPLAPLDETLDKIDFAAADIWGATESWQRRYHLQSFFLAVGRKALESEAWKRFWSQVRPIKSKTWVIRHYEVGLTGRMLAGGLRCAAIWPYQTMLRAVDASLLEQEEIKDPLVASRKFHVNRVRIATVRRRPLNPTADLWRQMLRARFPFLKRELLVKNPSFIEDVADWRDVVAEVFGADIGFIERDLQRAMRDTTP
jgi:lipopolysaccharide biosynthesis protein